MGLKTDAPGTDRLPQNGTSGNQKDTFGRGISFRGPWLICVRVLATRRTPVRTSEASRFLVVTNLSRLHILIGFTSQVVGRQSGCICATLLSHDTLHKMCGIKCNQVRAHPLTVGTACPGFDYSSVVASANLLPLTCPNGEINGPPLGSFTKHRQCENQHVGLTYN